MLVERCAPIAARGPEHFHLAIVVGAAMPSYKPPSLPGRRVEGDSIHVCAIRCKGRCPVLAKNMCR